MNNNDRVRLVDLDRQLRPLMEDLEEAAAGVIRSGWFLFGKQTESFEQAFAEWLGIENVVGCANGTDAITLALGGLDIGEGNKVITVPNTAFPTACAISRAGALPVFADIDPETWLLDIEKAVEAVDASTRAIIPVHLYGHVFDVPALRRAAPGGVSIVEDCAQAHCATLNGRKTGTLGDIAAFSFYPSKNLCALGDAGAVASRDKERADKVRRLRFYGQGRRDHHTAVGMNSRIDEIQAAFLLLELEYVDRWVDRRREIASLYDSELYSNIFKRPAITGNSDPSYHLYVISVEDRDGFRSALSAEGIDTGVHYPVPIHLQPAYNHLGYSRGDFPCAESLAARIVSLPVGPHLGEQEVARVISACNRYAGAGGD